MATYRQFVYEVLESTKLAHATARMTLPQVIYSCQLAINTIMEQHLSKMRHYSDAYLQIFDVNVTLDAGGGWYHFDLPAGIFDFDMDKGIDFVTYTRKSNGKWLCNKFTRTTPKKLTRYKKSPYEKPTPDNPYFYRVNNKVHLVGVESLMLTTVTTGLLVTANINLEQDLDAIIPLDEPHLAYARMMVEDLIRFGMAITPERENDGSDLAERYNQLPDILRRRNNQPAQQQQQQQVDGNQ